MNGDLVERLVRTGLQVAGAVVAGKYMTEEQWLAVSGALVTVLTTVWTVFAAKKAAK
jgi:hypothetical protein